MFYRLRAACQRISNVADPVGYLINSNHDYLILLVRFEIQNEKSDPFGHWEKGKDIHNII